MIPTINSRASKPRRRFDGRHTDLSVTRVLHAELTRSCKGYLVWEIFLAQHIRPANRYIPYETFLAQLQANGHGHFALDDLPALCAAMRRQGIDPAPALNLLAEQCQAQPPVPDGNLLDELLDLLKQGGDMAHKVDGSTLRDLPRSELHAILGIAARIRDIADRTTAEIAAELGNWP